MIKYETEKFELSDDDILWEKFMCFMREIIPYEEKELSLLTEEQRSPVLAFIYSSEVMGEGHIGFFDLYGSYIKSEDIINAFRELYIPQKYIDIVEKAWSVFKSVSQDADSCLDEAEFEKKMELLDEKYDKIDDEFYQYEDEEIDEKIIEYVRQYHLAFFNYI